MRSTRVMDFFQRIQVSQKLCAESGVTFIGPTSDIMGRFGNKVEARALAIDAGVPVMPATGPLPNDEAEVAALATKIGFPLMLKASWGGGGRGMRVIEVHPMRKRAQI